MDQWRAVAVLLMIADHLLLVTATGFPLRVTVTRVSLPLFMLLAGSLRAHHPWDGWLRYRDVAMAVLLTGPLALYAGIGFDPMLSAVAGIALAGAAVHLCHRQGWPVLLAGVVLLVAGFTHQPFFASQVGVPGYSPLWTAGLATLGAVIPVTFWQPVTGPLGAMLTKAGRLPRTFYLTHLLAIAALTAI